MKAMQWIIIALLSVNTGLIIGALGAKDSVIKTQWKAIATLERTVATYHRRLTGEPHPLYKETP